MKSTDRGAFEFARFVVAGAVSTVLTFAFYLGLLQFLGYAVAYSLAYAAGIALGYGINSIWVFARKPRVRTALVYPLIQAANYVSGLAVLAFLVEFCRVPKALAPIGVVLITVPFTYVLTRALFKRAGAP